MKTLVMALLAALFVSSVDAVAQPERPTLDHPSARNTLSEQLGEINTRIDHRVADGRLSKEDADVARREAYDIDAEAADKRLQNGGELSERDRFALQERIRQLVGRIDRESGEPPPRP